MNTKRLKVTPKAIVVGAGIAGIASALRLNHQGYDVTVFEANAHTGGKLHAKKLGAYRFDMGPSLFTMPHLVDELFELYNENPVNYFNYNQKEIICNYFWDDGATFQVTADEEKFISEAANFFEEKPEQIKAYLEQNKKKYDLTANLFLEKSLHKVSTYLSKSTLKAIFQLHKLDIYKSLNEVNKNYFSNPKLVQLFNRYATYNGSNPYKTPGIMSMIPHLEMHFGTYYPKNGMHEISQSLTRLAVDKGIKFRLSTPVQHIKSKYNKVLGVQADGHLHEADIVVSNMDVFGSYHKLLKQAKKPEKTLRQERSSSAMIFYWGIKKTFPELDLHNIFFSSDYANEFSHLFEKKDICEDPTVYVNITSKEDKNDAPEGCENWFVMVNAPTHEGQNWKEIAKKTKKNILNKLNKVLGVKLEQLIEEEMIWDPSGIESDTFSHQGSLYGASSNNQFSAFLRHPNFSRQYPNLFFCGGSVHPGGGIPLCLLSAKIVGDLTKKYYPN